MIKATLIAAAIAAAGVVQAQTPASTAKKELIAKIIQLQQAGVEGLARNLTEQPAMQTMQQAGAALPRLPAERREAVARDIEADVRKFVEETTPIVRERALKLAPSTIGAVMDEKFSEDELRQIVTILESPLQKKFQAAFPEMQRALAEKLVAETRPEVEVKLRALQSTVAQRLSGPPASEGSAPRTAPQAPAAAPPKK